MDSNLGIALRNPPQQLHKFQKLKRLKTMITRLFDLIDQFIAKRFGNRPDSGRFVIFTSGRSGSNFFLSVINQHPSIYCFSELFHPDKIWVGEDCEVGRLGGSWAYAFRQCFPRTFILTIWMRNRNKDWTGFKYIWFHTPKIRDSVLLNEKIKKVLLTRRNILRTEISRQIADETNEWIKHDGKATCTQVRFDLDKFWRHHERTLHQIETLKRELNDRKQPYIEIFFEDLAGENRDPVLAEFCRQMEIEPWTFDVADVSTKRQNPFTLPEILLNFEEVRSSLTGTNAEWMLGD
jgi:hypothetical protein